MTGPRKGLFRDVLDVDVRHVGHHGSYNAEHRGRLGIGLDNCKLQL
jgi:hypothetical protein